MPSIGQILGTHAGFLTTSYNSSSLWSTLLEPPRNLHVCTDSYTQHTNNICKKDILNSFTSFSLFRSLLAGQNQLKLYKERGTQLRPWEACSQSEADQIRSNPWTNFPGIYLDSPVASRRCCFWARPSLCRPGRLQTWNPLASASVGWHYMLVLSCSLFKGISEQGRRAQRTVFLTFGRVSGLHWLLHSRERPNCHFPNPLPNQSHANWECSSVVVST